MHLNVNGFPRHGNFVSVDFTIDEEDTDSVLVQVVVNDSCPRPSNIPLQPSCSTLQSADSSSVIIQI